MGNARSLKRWDAATGAGPTLFPFISQCIRIYYAEAGGSLRCKLTVMNRFLTFISALALTGMIQAGAYEIYYDDLGSGYSFILETETRTAQMNSYLNESNFSGGALVIPEKINFSSENYDESVWGEYAIAGELSIYWSEDKVKQSLTSVKIPEGITSISGDTFYNCTNLETIEFPSTLTSIGEQAFYNCTALKSVEFPRSLVSIGVGAFYSTALENIILPSSLTTIGDGAFSGCSQLATIEFSEHSSLTSIGEDAFHGCTALKSIILPSSLTTIGNEVFSGCSQLTTIEFAEHSSLTSIGDYAFNGCRALKSVEFPKSLVSIGSEAFYDCGSLQTVSFGENVEEIGVKAFFNCTALENIILPSSLTTIGNYAFSGCSQLATIEFAEHSSLTSIGEYAFKSCTALKSVGFMKSLVSIGRNAFYGCGSLQTISFGENVEEIGERAFYGCTALENITFNYSSVDKFLTSSVEGFPYGCFGEDGSTNIKEIRVTNLINGQPMKNVLIPMGMETIKDYAFWNDVNVESVTFPDGFKSIPAGAFRRTAIKVLKMPASLETIGDRAFEGCDMLEEITFNEGLKTIGERAFQRCTAIAGIVLPNSVTEAGISAFAQCEDLESVVLSTSLTKIPRGMFSACYHLAECVIPESVTEIGSHAFGHNFNLREIDLGSNVKSVGAYAFSIADGGGDYEQNVAIWEILNKYASLRQNKFKVKLSEGLASIGERAFEGREGLDAVRLPSTLASVGNMAFAGTAIREITVPDAMTTIGMGAFAQMNSLKRVKLPATLTEIGQEAFRATALTDIEIPEGVTTIGESAFAQCDLKSLSLPDAVTSVGANFIEDNNSLAYLSLGAGVGELPKMASNISRCFLKMGAATPPTLGTDRLGFTPTIVLVPEGCGYAYTKSNRWKDYNISAANGNVATVYVNEPGTLATEIRLSSGLFPAQVSNLIITGGTLNEDDFAIMRSNMRACYDIDLTLAGNTEIPAGAFTGRSMLLNIKLPAATTAIGDNAFTNCAVMHLESLPATLETIGEGAFSGCTGMDSELSMPASLTRVGANAFAGSGVKRVDFSGAEGLDLSNAYNLFGGCRNLSEVVLPNATKMIPGSMFKGSGLSEVYLPEGLESIGSEAFKECGLLKGINLPSTVNNIGDRAFAYSGLEGIDLPKSVTEMGEYVFTGSKVAYVNFPAGLTGISSGMAKDCPDLIVVNLPRKLQSIGNEALNSASIAAISSPSQLPAATNGNPWESIDNMTCALSIPKPSLVKYMLAEYWGAFVDIRNSIDVTIEVEEPEEEPTPGENPGGETGEDAADADAADDVLTYIDENDYQTMLEEQEENMEEEPAPAEARRRALRTLRRAGVIAPNKGYGKLFNNSSLYRDGGQSTRFFLNVDSDKKYSVMYNGQDITDAVDTETNSFVIDGFDKTSSLHVKVYSGIQSGIDAVEVSADDPFAGGKADIYSTTGICVKPAAMAEDLRMLPSGIYIVNGRKIVVR